MAARKIIVVVGAIGSQMASRKTEIVGYIEAEQPTLVEKTSLIQANCYTETCILHTSLGLDSSRYTNWLPLKEDTRISIIDVQESDGPFGKDNLLSAKLLAYNSYLSTGEVVDKRSKVRRQEAGFGPITTQELHEKIWVGNEFLDGQDYVTEFGCFTGVERLY